MGYRCLDLSHIQINYYITAPLPAPVKIRASAQATSISLTWEQPPGVDDVESYEIIYNYTVHECRAESDSNNFSTVNVTLSGSLKNYTILNSLVTPVEEDSTYTISLMAANRSTGERSEATTVTVTTYTAS